MRGQPPKQGGKRRRSSRPDLLGGLFDPIDIASLVYFRIAFGAIMLWEVWRYLSMGRIARYYLEPAFLFTYLGFDWVRPWPGDGMYLHFYALGVLSVFIMVGFLYRLSATLFFLGFTYVFLLDQTQYLNHFYFVSLVAFLMILVPAHRSLSVDGWMRGRAWRSSTAPAWSLWILRAQMGFVYFFAGVAKLNGDWLRGYPLRDWLADAAHLPVIGPHMTEAWVAVPMSWGGLLLDLFVVPALLWRKTRPYAFAASLGFHLMNAVIFHIGIFPWFSIAATLLFFDPDWPRRLLRRPRLQIDERTSGSALGLRERATLALVGLYVVIQVLLPLRHFLYPGNASWTEDGHRFAWHQKLRSKDGWVRFLAIDPSTGESWEIDVRRFLTARQYRKMADRPYMILQLAHHLADLAAEQGKPRIEVRVSAMSSLNGREIQPLIDPTVDLAAQPRTFFAPYRWIVPLEVPLEAQWDGKSPPTHPVAIALIEKHRDRFRAQLKERLAE